MNEAASADGVPDRARSGPPRALPPGQRLVPDAPVMHYGRVPRARAGPWTLTFDGRTSTGDPIQVPLTRLEDELDRHTLVSDMHCGHGWTALDRAWAGWSARDVIDLAPPADDVTHVLVYAEYGYSATIALEDLASARSLLATAVDGADLTPERGWPVRLVIPHLYTWKGPKWLRGWTYLDAPERGFWEQRGYHLKGDAWAQERYSHME